MRNKQWNETKRTTTGGYVFGKSPLSSLPPLSLIPLLTVCISLLWGRYNCSFNIRLVVEVYD